MVTGVFPSSPPRYFPSFVSRVGFSIPSRRFSCGYHSVRVLRRYAGVARNRSGDVFVFRCFSRSITRPPGRARRCSNTRRSNRVGSGGARNLRGWFGSGVFRISLTGFDRAALILSDPGEVDRPVKYLVFFSSRFFLAKCCV